MRNTLVVCMLAATSTAGADSKKFSISEEDRDYWAFRPVVAPELAVGSKGNPIDALVGEKLRQANLKPNGTASRRDLIRRAYFNLTGLPPTFDEVEAFEEDDSPKAYEKLLDDLLASPRYGERWGRHWLDVVRFGQTNGYERDDEKPLAWRYRDYVVRSFNEDKPYDRFVVEQIAGDELEDGGAEGLIATGFYRLGVWDDEPDDKRAAEFDGLDDVIRATGESFLGLTIGCARCHDHMFDPISHRDYYELLAVFRNMRPYAKPNYKANSATYSPLPKVNGKPAEFALTIREQGSKPPETRLLLRGDAGAPGEKVTPRLPEIFGNEELKSSPPKHKRSTGLRLALAKWIAGKDNPLTARVIVNRIWQHHFGRGLVETPNDFGRAGSGVSHPALLDHLASAFMERGWSMKRLHKQIMLSETYRRSSTPDAANAKTDPGNRLLWRQNLRRLEAEAIRDAMLKTSGRLNLEVGGRGFFPTLGGEVIAGGSKPGRGYDYSSPQEQNRRSIYTFIKRTMGDPFLEAFDYANTEGPVGIRPNTTVAPQALTLLNSDFANRQADAAAGLAAAKQSSATRLYRRLLSREPSKLELDMAKRFLRVQTRRHRETASVLRFQPEVPASLSSDFMRKLPASLFMPAPDGWKSHKGVWEGGYESILNVDPAKGPFALFPFMEIRDAVVSGRIALDGNARSAGVILRGRATQDRLEGLEFLLDASSQRSSLRLHGDLISVLAETEVAVLPGQWISFEARLEEDEVRVFINGNSSSSLSAKSPAFVGLTGIRSWGGSVYTDRLSVRTKDASAAWHAIDGARTRLATRTESDEIEGWKAYGGAWSAVNGDTLRVEGGQGPKLLWEEFGKMADGVVSMDFRIKPRTGPIAGFILRVDKPAVGADNWIGYEVSVDVSKREVFIGTHNFNWRRQATASWDVEAGRWHRMEVRMNGAIIAVHIDDSAKPALEFRHPDPLPAGMIGLRTWGPEVEYRNLTARAGERILDFESAPQEAESEKSRLVKRNLEEVARRRALTDLASTLFNLNEFVYLD